MEFINTRQKNNLSMSSLRSALVVLTCVLLVACGSAPVIDENNPTLYQPQTKPDVSTLEYIPTLKKNSKGQLIPYVPSENPYLKRWGSVKQESIALYINAKRAFEAANFEQAEAILTGLTETDKKLSGPWVMLGDIALHKNDLSLAEQRYSNAILLNKNNVNAYLRLAKVKRMQGDFLTAKNTYADVLALWKDFPEAHLNLGVLYDLYLNDDVKAQKHIEAYQFLTGGKNEKAAQWLIEIQERTGIETELKIPEETTVIKPVS